MHSVSLLMSCVTMMNCMLVSHLLLTQFLLLRGLLSKFLVLAVLLVGVRDLGQLVHAGHFGTVFHEVLLTVGSVNETVVGIGEVSTLLGLSLQSPLVGLGLLLGLRKFSGSKHDVVGLMSVG